MHKPMDPVNHTAGCMLNISSAQLAQPKGRGDRGLAADPVRVGLHAINDQEAIYARVIGLLVREHDLDLQQVLAMELTAYPPSMFHVDGRMQLPQSPR